MFGVYQLNNDLKWERLKLFEDVAEANHFKKMELRRNTNPIRVFVIEANGKPKGVDNEDLVE